MIRSFDPKNWGSTNVINNQSKFGRRSRHHCALFTCFFKYKLLYCAGLAILLNACSGDDGRVPVYPVKGKVAVAGEPPIGALVVLYPARPVGEKDLRPSAKIGQDGIFSLTTYVADDGAPAGEYTATIQWNKLVKKGPDYSAGPNVVPKQYAARETSPWKINVESKFNELAPINIVE
jgi:hypothetical protein